MIDYIHEFLDGAARANTSFHNEATLQMELAIFIRGQRPDLRTQFERPITDFGARESGGKKEIDICMLDAAGAPFSAIEVKMPDNGRVPESMFDYCRDIRFCESLVAAGFKSSCALLFTPNRTFHEGRRGDGIYSFFRNGAPLTGTILKPTGLKNKEVVISGTYGITWRTNHRAFAYAATEVQSQPE